MATTPRRANGAASAAASAAALGLAAGAVLTGGEARAQFATGGATALPVGTPTVLPATGTDVRVGNLRDQVSSLLRSGPAPLLGPNFIIQPSIGVDVGATDNALQASSPRRADVFTVISPAVSLTGDSARLQVNATYSPVISLFAQTSSRTRVDQYLSGDALATVVRDLFYVDLRAAITQSSITGGYGPYGSSSLNGTDQVQTSTVSLTPYLIHRFDGWGTATVSYNFSYSNQSGYGNGNNGTLFGPYGTPVNYGAPVNTSFSGDQDLITNQELAQFTTGENLGRVNLTAAVNLQQYSGTGSYDGAYRNLYTINGAYALNRSISLIGQIGYEDLRYTGPFGVAVNSPVFQAGVRWTPNADSSISVTYGREDGLDSVYLNGTYAPTARTRIYASYSDGLTSSAEQQQSLLNAATFTNGYATNAITGAPLVSTNNAFGTQNLIYEDKLLSVTAVLQRPRDTYSVSVVHEERRIVGGGSSLSTIGSNYGGTYGQFSWQHDLSPAASTTAYVQYGTDTITAPLVGQNASGNVEEQFVSASAGVNYAISATLAGRASYILNSRFGSGVPGRDYLENIVIVGLRKGF